MEMEEVPSWAIKLIEESGKTNGILEQVLIQVQKTNSRVTKLEDKTIPEINKRIDSIESENDTSAGQKTVWIWISKVGGTIGGIVLAAAAGAWFGGKR
ncbi:MAG TPA: hypothetical protein DDW50_20940 [Firmicutes bacterium]|jgi:hypothetical protein|nr:hypothetical protein [Bacillota bacterium]